MRKCKSCEHFTRGTNKRIFYSIRLSYIIHYNHFDQTCEMSSIFWTLGHEVAGSNPREGIDIIPLVKVFTPIFPINHASVGSRNHTVQDIVRMLIIQRLTSCRTVCFPGS